MLIVNWGSPTAFRISATIEMASASARVEARSDDVRVALPELAEPAPLRLLGPPDRGNVIPLEWHRQLVLVIGDEAGQRHCQVIAQTDGAIAMIEKVIHQLLVLAGLASQDFEVLEVGVSIGSKPCASKIARKRSIKVRRSSICAGS